MACPTGTISYAIQTGDTLYKIAAKYNTTYQAILSANPGINPNILYIGQQICIPIAQATLQIATQPIMVNGVNINTGQYPVLNYKPANAQYPYIYVPIAEFSRVGANVAWDNVKQLLTVTTDYYTQKKTIEELQAKITSLQTSIPSCCILIVTSIETNLTDAEKIEILCLAATKNQDELSSLQQNAYTEANAAAAAKGGTVESGAGLASDGIGFSMNFTKDSTNQFIINVTVHTNDPKLEDNYSKYTNEQKAIVSKHMTAAFYVAYKDITEKIQVL
ncbi:MAG: LysM peptidoglycan-binding domain-containing protein [Bacillota bacterium]|nr:LysM peptidoglycan-binding domain-containing protein [Bacillota bacterium]